MNRARTASGWVLLALATVGLAVSGVTLSVHNQIAATGGQYASFCTFNETVNCDVVLASPHAYFVGVPVAGWAVLTYLVLAGLAAGAMGARRFTRRLRCAQLAFGLAVWSAAFSAYMAAVAFLIIRAVCVLCSSLYVINAGVLAVAWMAYASIRGEGRSRSAAASGFERGGRLVLGVSVAVGVLLLGSAVWDAFARRGGVMKLEDVAQLRPDFYQWYTSQPVLGPSVDGRNSKGSTGAGVTIVEFSDFECGHCARAYRTLKQVLPRYRGEVRVVFRHFPLDASCNKSVQGQGHANACAAAVAAECAGEQGKFWEFHDRLFENQSRLDRASLREHARQVGLNMQAFEQCVTGGQARSTVERDLQEGLRLGITSTPTLLLNGRAIKGMLEPELLEYAIGIERAQRRS